MDHVGIDVHPNQSEICILFDQRRRFAFYVIGSILAA